MFNIFDCLFERQSHCFIERLSDCLTFKRVQNYKLIIIDFQLIAAAL